jgi:hypothetical protein
MVGNHAGWIWPDKAVTRIGDCSLCLHVAALDHGAHTANRPQRRRVSKALEALRAFAKGRGNRPGPYVRDYALAHVAEAQLATRAGRYALREAVALMRPVKCGGMYRLGGSHTQQERARALLRWTHAH